MPLDPRRYALAHVPAHPEHRTRALSLVELLALLREQHALGFRWLPFFVFQDGEATARALWCPVCGRVSWNGNDVLHWYCGYCHRFFRG